MATAKLLGIDVGTSSAKAVLIDENGIVISTASCDHPTYNPAPACREQEATDWWHGAVASVRQILAESDINPAEIAGISLGGQGCACLPVSHDGEPLGRATIWTDERARVEQARICEIFGSDLGRVAGNDIYDQPEPRMMWLRDHEPQIYSATFKFLTTVSYLVLRLTGKMAANHSDWGFHLSLDRAALEWNEAFIAAVGLDSARFPDLYAPTDIVGTVAAQAAAETGLAVGTPVVAGGQDATVSALAVGALEVGQCVFVRGTTDLLSICTDRPDYRPGLYTTCAVLPGLYTSYDMKEVVAAGASFKWLANILFGRADRATFETMDHLAASSPPGSNAVILLPYLLMSTNPDPAQQRAGQFFGLTTTTQQADLCRAVMEGTAYALREEIDRMAAEGITITELRTTGGPTRSKVWNQITADVTGLPILLPIVSEGAAYGAALLAGLGAGVYALNEGYESLKRVIQVRERVAPDPGSRTTYDRTYNAFRALAASTSGIAASLRAAH